MLIRYFSNPVLSPKKDSLWESEAVFNPSVIKKDNQFIIFYRAIGEEKVVEGNKIKMSMIGKAESVDGINFTKRQPFIFPQFEWEKYGCEDPRVCYFQGRYYIFYTALSQYPPSAQGIKVAVAVSDDLKVVQEKHLVTFFNAKAMTLFPEKVEGKYYALLTIHTDRPPTEIVIAPFEKIEQLWERSFWEDWYDHWEDLIIPLKRFSDDQIEVGATPLKIPQGWLLIYSYIKHYLTVGVEKQFRIEAALLDLKNPKKIIGRIEKPLLIPEANYEKEGMVKNIVFPTSALFFNNRLRVYYGGADTVCAFAEEEKENIFSQIRIQSPIVLKAKKFSHNPILTPKDENDWEAKAVFNAGAIEINEKIYLLYRAMSKKNLSQFGLAISEDGYLIDERLTSPIYPLRLPFEKPKKDGLAGGVEDPRLTVINDKIYMCYTAYDGEMPRLAFTSIAINDFLKRKFNRWAIPKIISPIDVADKDGALFPEKINGKYVFLHRIEPNIVIDFVDDLEFFNKKTLDATIIFVPKERSWEGVKVGINGPPIKTSVGWLVFYHGISRIDHYYRIGAMLLDLKNPIKVCAYTPYPILEPEMEFEKKGLVNNVVFSCGQIVKGDKIFIYYGGADQVLCGAEISLSSLLNYLTNCQKKRYLNF